MKLSLSLTAILITSLMSPLASAQNAQLSGLVKDKSDAVIASATVTLTNIETGAILTAKSGKAGLYVFASVASGRYTLTGDAPGFSKTVVSNLKLDTAAYVSQDIVLQVASSSESVTVKSDPSAELVEVTGAVSTVIDRPLIENMPLNGNSLQTLFELTPGVVTNAGGSPSYGGGISVNGQRPTSNYLMVDGASENIYIPPTYGRPNVMGAGIASSASGGTNGLLPVDAVEEFRMQTSSYSAEYGRTPGGQINVTTRGGTNGFHGGVFESFRNQVLDGEDWFIKYNNAIYGSDVKQPPLRMNDFGGSLGGPILKDRLFFFIAHESLYMNQPQPSISGDVPDQPTRSAAASVFQPYLALYPAGNGGGDPKNPGSNILNFSYSNLIRDHTTSLRLDATLPQHMTAFFRWNFAPSYLEIPYIFSSTRNNIRITTFTTGLSWQLSTRMINELTINYSSNNGAYGSGNVPQGFIRAASGLVNTSNTSVVFSPNIWVTLGAGPGQESRLHQFNVLDTLTWVAGKHTLKIGGDYRRYDPTLTDPSLLQLYSNYSATSIQSGILDYVTYVKYENTPRINASNSSLYLDDTWRAGKDLALNLGFRWDYNPPPSASAPGLLAMQGDPNDPATITLAPAGTPLYNTRHNNLAPRLGFAYAVRDSPRFETALRGGGGIFWDTGQSVSGAQAAQLSYPYFDQSPPLVNVPYTSLNVNQIQATLVGLPQNQLYLTSPTLLSPRVYEWSLTLDQNIGTQTIVSAGYVGNHGDKLLKQSIYNGLSPTLANTLYVYANGENASYNALQTQIRVRATKRANVLASYTLAHALDNGSNDFTGVGGYQKNYRADSDSDIRHIFSSAIHYSPGGLRNTRLVKAITDGWSLDSVALLQSAAPLSVYSYSSQNPNRYNYYADIVPGVSAIISDPLAPGGSRLNPAAFAIAPPTRDGTSMRNGYRLFGLKQFDFAIARNWPLWEGSTMTFRMDAFNVFNHPNFANIDTYYYSGGLRMFGEATTTYAGAFGSTNAQGGALNQVFSNGGARSLQLGLRVRF